MARCERRPAPGETVAATSFDRVPGGKGANQAVAAARLGADTTMIGCVGRDVFAAEALRGLGDAGVDVRVIEVDAPTGVALIAVDEQGETQITVVAGANAAVGPDIDLPAAAGVMCQLEIPARTVAAVARKVDGFFCLNAAPAEQVPAEA